MVIKFNSETELHKTMMRTDDHTHTHTHIHIRNYHQTENMEILKPIRDR